MSTLASEIIIELLEVQQVTEQIKKVIAENEIVAFVKGDAHFPQCGFSARAIQVLNLIQKPFCTIDVLKNQTLREVVKSYSDWPTIPQIYWKGEFLGGSDILLELYQSGELQKKFHSGD